MRRRSPYLVPLILLATSAPASAATRTLEFENQVQNIRIATQPLRSALARPVTIDCADARGPAGFGELPHRILGEGFGSTEHFIAFAAVYPPGERPVLFIDHGSDRRLTCDERVDPVVHPRDPEVLFRTIEVAWRDGGPARSRMYRINVPARVDGQVAIDLVQVPVARWNVQGTDSLWILYDGNHDGMLDRRFGDAVLVDPTGSGRIDLDPEGPNLFSFHAPLELPWGAFEVTTIEPSGRTLVLRELAGFDAEHYRALEVGDAVAAMSCRTSDGSEAVIGGATGRTQVVYFWLSHCGSCREAMNVLSPLFRELAAGGVGAVGISLDESEASFRSFVDERPLDWPQCFSGTMLTDNALARRFGVYDPSTLVVIGPDGRIAAKLKHVSELRGVLQQIAMERERAGL
jgi:peroxiredoxin